MIISLPFLLKKRKTLSKVVHFHFNPEVFHLKKNQFSFDGYTRC